ncbi:MAG TPA: dTDP-4-dehydrorhamnose reductase, partial [Clostridiales bacterium]|nr:dTDP-4-dehydrorhamnose reductase [Clostridiales bacterium]
DMLQTEQYGVYHATNEGYCSWFEFADAIMTDAGLACHVRPVTSEQYPTKAVRPKNSRLSKDSLDAAGFTRLPGWHDALVRYLVELGER